MLTLIPGHILARQPSTGTLDRLSADGLTGNEGSARVVALVIVVLLLALALRTMGRALEPIIEIARMALSVGLAALLMLVALVLVVVIVAGAV